MLLKNNKRIYKCKEIKKEDFYMVNYEPELMYALDSKSEYADWKNVYNVSGSDVLYCPICLGRVKLWNGQDPNKAYKKQRCFHHIDGMCSQESRIHFAYKTWLLEQGSKFKVGETIYEVVNSEIEKTFHTKFGDYRPDITVETTEGKRFYIEIADTNKKNGDYISKWHELSNDVLELDVNEQLTKASTKEIPNFKLIYSSTTGMCFVKEYIPKKYDEVTSQLNKCWSRYDLMKRKQLWERFDWFWLNTQKYYSNEFTIDDICYEFQKIDKHGKQIIYSCIKGSKHSIFRKYFLDILRNDFYKYLENIKEFFDSYGYKTSTSLNSSSYNVTVKYSEDEYFISCMSKNFALDKNYSYEEILDLERFLAECNEGKNRFKKYIKKLRSFKNLSFIDIYPTYGVRDLYEIQRLRFNINYKANIHNKYILESIGHDSWELLDDLKIDNLKEHYNIFLEECLQEKEAEFVTHAINNDNLFMFYLNDITQKVKKISRLKLKISKDYRAVSLFDNAELLIEWNFTENLIFGDFENNFYDSFMNILTPLIDTEKERRINRRKINKVIKQYGDMLNNSVNQIWSFEFDYLKRWKISVLNYVAVFNPEYSVFPLDEILLEEHIKKLFGEYMNETIRRFNEAHWNIRIMEGR